MEKLLVYHVSMRIGGGLALAVLETCAKYLLLQVMYCYSFSSTVCFIDLGKLNWLKISIPWSKSVKQTVSAFISD
jgi:hypothetical protein